MTAATATRPTLDRYLLWLPLGALTIYWLLA